MPITQDRMIALIEVARDCYDSWNAIGKAIRESYLQDPGNEAVQALLQLSIGIAPKDDSLVYLGAEEAHFRIYRLHNEGQRIRQANNRRGIGVGSVAKIAREERRQKNIELSQPRAPQGPAMSQAEFERLYNDPETIRTAAETARVRGDSFFKPLIGAVQPDGTVIQPDGLESGSPDPGLPDVDKLIG